MATWQKAIREFKAKSQTHDGEVAAVVLMYLAIKKNDYPYHMASIFKKELNKKNSWKIEKLNYLKSLTDKNQLTILLSNMQKAGFLESIKEESRRPKRIYRLKIDVMSSPFANTGIRKLYYNPPFKNETQKNELNDIEIIKNFFLSKFEISDVHDYFVKWSEIDKFDFITFLGLLKNEAEKMNDSKMKELMVRNIYDTQKHEKAVLKLKSHSEIIDKMESENRKRTIYREPSIYEKISKW